MIKLIFSLKTDFENWKCPIFDSPKLSCLSIYKKSLAKAHLAQGLCYEYKLRGSWILHFLGISNSGMFFLKIFVFYLALPKIDRLPRTRGTCSKGVPVDAKIYRFSSATLWNYTVVITICVSPWIKLLRLASVYLSISTNLLGVCNWKGIEAPIADSLPFSVLKNWNW